MEGGLRFPGYCCAALADSSGHLVEELLDRRADFLEPPCLHHRQIRTRNVPEVRRNLIFRDEVLDLGAANPRPAFDFAELEVEDIRDLGAEIIDIRIPVAV